MISLYGYKLYRERYAGNHDLYLSELMKSQWLGPEELAWISQQRFLSIFRKAVQHVPYYRELVRSERIDTNAVKSIADIGKLPILSKERLRRDSARFIDETVKKSELITINTSGTSGKTLRITVDKDSRRRAYAFFSRLKSWAGIDSKSKNVTFAGRTIVPPDAVRPPYWRKNGIMNNHLFSSYHLSLNNIGHYVDALKNIQPELIDSYPSSLYVVALYMKERKLGGVNPRAIITSSETLLDHQRDVIEEVFGCPIFDQYGCAEQVVFISQCEKGSYHIHPEFGFVEFINDDGSKARPGEPARMICTGFTNQAMPLIRYDIGDKGVFVDKKCACGRNFPVIEHVVGRNDDMIITSDGRQVGRLDPVFKGLVSIREAQIVQEECDCIVLKIVPGNGYQKSDADIVVHELKKRLGNRMRIDVEMVSAIPRTSAGKFRAVISKVKRV